MANLTKLQQNGLSLPTQIIKRNGAYVAFDLSRVERAVRLCYASLDKLPYTPVDVIVSGVANRLAAHQHMNLEGSTPSVEEVQEDRKSVV